MATIVITNHRHQHVVDNSPYNHYSLLLTIERAFRLPCLQNACDEQAGVKPMAPLFAFGAQPRR